MVNKHSYATLSHDRTTIGKYLGIVHYLFSLTGWEVVLNFTLSASIIYLGLYYLFLEKIWKMKFLRDYLKIPDLNGSWNIKGETLKEDGSIKELWTGVWQVKQDWEKILIHLKTSNSESYSYTATLYKKDIGGWSLSYSYSNEPFDKSNQELKQHKGFCEIDFDENIQKGEARYFNSKTRRTFGNMNLEKI